MFFLEQHAALIAEFKKAWAWIADWRIEFDLESHCKHGDGVLVKSESVIIENILSILHCALHVKKKSSEYDVLQSLVIPCNVLPEISIFIVYHPSTKVSKENASDTILTGVPVNDKKAL